MSSFKPHLMILDVMLPDMEGFEVASRLGAQRAGVPIIFLTARDTTEDKVRGLSGGGDDYMTKPFSLEELVARIRTILRRSGQAAPESGGSSFEDLEMDEESREVTRAGEPIALTATEYRLLRYLMLNPRRVLTRAQLLDHVWNYDFGGDGRVLETYISYLRKKLDAHGPSLIRTVRGVGYALAGPTPADDLAARARPRQRAAAGERGPAGARGGHLHRAALVPGGPPRPAGAASRRRCSRATLDARRLRDRSARATSGGSGGDARQRAFGPPAFARRRRRARRARRRRRPAARRRTCSRAPTASAATPPARSCGHVFITFGQRTPAAPKLPGPRAPWASSFTVGSVGSSGLRYRAFATRDPDTGGLTIAAVPTQRSPADPHHLLLVEALVIAAVLLTLGDRRLAGRASRAAPARTAWRPPPARSRPATCPIASAPPTSRTEVGRLGLALNAMLDRLEEAFQQREASEARLRRFLADASHELRTPLASIRGYAELFRMGATADPAATENAMRRIEEEAERMGVLVEDLLALARLDRPPEHERELVDLSRARRRRRRRRPRRGAGADDHARGRARRERGRRPAPAAPGAREPAAQRAHPHTRGEPRRGRACTGATAAITLSRARPRAGPSDRLPRAAVRAFLARPRAAASAAAAAPGSGSRSRAPSSRRTAAPSAPATQAAGAPSSSCGCPPSGPCVRPRPRRPERPCERSSSVWATRR